MGHLYLESCSLQTPHVGVIVLHSLPGDEAYGESLCYRGSCAASSTCPTVTAHSEACTCTVTCHVKEGKTWRSLPSSLRKGPGRRDHLRALLRLRHHHRLALFDIPPLRNGATEIPVSTGARDPAITMDVFEVYSNGSIHAMAKAVLPQSANVPKSTREFYTHDGTDAKAVRAEE